MMNYREIDTIDQEVMRLRGDDTQVSEAPPRIIISHGTQMKADVMWSSTDKGVQMTDVNKAHNQHSCPYPTLISDGGEDGK